MLKTYSNITDKLVNDIKTITGVIKFIIYLPHNDGVFLNSSLQKFNENIKKNIKKILKDIDDNVKNNCTVIKSKYVTSSLRLITFQIQNEKAFIVIKKDDEKKLTDNFCDILSVLAKDCLEKILLLELSDLNKDKLEEYEELFLLRSFELEEKYERARKINQIISDISSELNFDKAVQIIIDKLKDLYSFEGYTLALVEHDKKRYKYYSYDFPFEISDDVKAIMEKHFHLDDTGGRIAQAIKEKRHFYFYDVDKINIKSKINKFAVDTLKIKSTLIIPFGKNEEVFGVLSIFGHTKNLNLTDEDIKVIKNFLNQIATVFRNSFLYTSLERKNKEIEKVYKVISAINSLKNFDEIFNVIIKELKELFDFESYALSLVDNEKNTHKYYSAYFDIEIPEEYKEIIYNEYPLDERGGRIAQSINENKTFYFKDVLYEVIDNPVNKKAAEAFQIRSQLIVPLTSYNETFGVITLTTHKKVLDLSKEDIEYIEGYLSQIATAFKGIFYSKLALEKKNELEAINEITRKVNSSLDLDNVLNFIISYLVEKYNFEGHVISVRNEDYKDKLDILHLKVDTIDENLVEVMKGVGVPLTFKSNPVARAFLDNNVTYINDVYKDEVAPEIKKIMEQIDVRSNINIPINLENKPVGVLTFYTFGENSMKLTQEDINSLKLFSDHISTAIRNSMLFKKVQLQKLEIEKEKDLTERILTYSPIAIVTMDDKGKIKLVNPSFTRLIGLSENMLKGMEIFEIDVLKENNFDKYLEKAFHGEAVNVEKIEFNNSKTQNKYVLSVLATPIGRESGNEKVENIMMMMVDNTEIVKKEMELEKRNKIIEEDLYLAKKIQDNLLPKKKPSFHGFSFSSKYIPMEQLGGDFYDYIKIDEENLGILISDVSGHGVSAAFITSMIKTNIDMKKNELLSPATFFTKLQDKMLPLLSDKYFTAFYGVFNKKNMTLTYSNAAHIPQIIIRAKNKVEQISMPSNFIGLYYPEDEPFCEQVIELNKKDRILFFTDGFIDNFKDNVLNGIDDLKLIYKKITNIIVRNLELQGESLLDKLIDEAKLNMGQEKFKDDIAMIVVEIN